MKIVTKQFAVKQIKLIDRCELKSIIDTELENCWKYINYEDSDYLESIENESTIKQKLSAIKQFNREENYFFEQKRINAILNSWGKYAEDFQQVEL